MNKIRKGDDVVVTTGKDKGKRGVVLNCLDAEPVSYTHLDVYKRQAQSELYLTLGSISQKLGKLDRADTLLNAAVSKRRALLGDDHPDVADALIELSALQASTATGRTRRATGSGRSSMACSIGRLPRECLSS